MVLGNQKPRIYWYSSVTLNSYWIPFTVTEKVYTTFDGNLYALKTVCFIDLKKEIFSAKLF